MALELKVDPLLVERNFVERVKNKSNENLVLIAYASYNILSRMSNLARTNPEAKALWYSLPQKMREFYSGLNFP